ncbi:hypothetical protein Tco_1193293, partial [Tanacetum coccineum]
MASHRLNPLYAIKECSTCGRLYTKECCSIGSLKDKVLVPEPVPSPRCARCGTPVDGPSCRGCAFLQKKFDEDLLAYCVKNGIFQDFQNTSESSDDNTNGVNALREPCVVNQDPGEKSSQGPPQIDQNCCYECGDSLDGIFCRQCICKSFGKGAYLGYNCPPRDQIISKPEPCNQTINEIPQTLPSLDPSCFSLPHVSKCDNPSISVCGNNALCYDCPPQFPFVYEQEPCYNQNFSDNYYLQNSPSFSQQYLCCAYCGGPHFDYQCQPINETCYEPNPSYDYSGFNHPQPPQESVYRQEALNKILKEFEELKRDQRMLTELKKQIAEEQTVKGDMSIEEMRHEQQLVDRKIKEITNDLGIRRFRGEEIDEEYERDCEITIHKLKQDFNVWGSKVRKKEKAYEERKSMAAALSLHAFCYFYSSKDRPFTRSSAGELAHIAPIHRNLLKPIDPNDNFDDDDDFEEHSNNSTPDRVLESPSPFSDAFFEESDTSFSHLDNSLPEFETFSDHSEETRSGNTTTHANYSLPEYESFYFDNPSIPRPPPEPPDIEKCFEPKAGILIIKEFKGVSKSHDFMTSILPTLVSDLPFISSIVSFENEDTIFDPGIVNTSEEPPKGICANEIVILVLKSLRYGYVKYARNQSKTNNENEMSDQEAKEIKAEAREIMPQPSTKFDEDLLAYCVKNGIFKDFQDTFEPSDDNTNVVNALREPFDVNKTPCKVSQDSPQLTIIVCYECGDSSNGIFCRQCISKSCANGAHYRVIIVHQKFRLSLIQNNAIKPLMSSHRILPIVHPKTPPSLEPSCYSLPHVSKPNFVDNSPYYPLQPQCEIYSCELCGNDSHYGYDCSLQFPFVYEQEPCYNQNFNDNYFLQNSQSYSQQYLCCAYCGGPHFDYQCQPINETCYEPNPSYDYSGFNHPQPPQNSVDCQEALDKIVKELDELKRDQRMLKELKKQIAEEQTIKENMSIEEMMHEQQLVDGKIKEITNDLGIRRFRGEEINEEYERNCEITIRKLKQDFNIWGSKVRKKEKAYEDEKYDAACHYMLSVTCDDEDDYIPLAITPDLPIEESDNSLIMGDEPLRTIPATESDKVIKSSVENLVPIPSEFEGISDDTCDVPTCDNNCVNVESELVESLINRDTLIVYSSKIDPIFEEFAGELAHIAPIPPGIVEADFDPNDDTSSDDDDFEDIEYVSLEEVNDEKEFNLEDIFQIQDVILREKLLNVHRLISKIESLK